MKTRLRFHVYHRRFRVPLRTAAGVFAGRAGLVLRLEDGTGAAGYGEVAPWPGFAGETLAEAARFLREAADTPALLDTVPAELPRVRAALEMARNFFLETAARQRAAPVPCAALLPSGARALAVLPERRAQGFATFKWKIGAASPDDEASLAARLLAALSPGEKLRLDANGGLESLAPWLTVLYDPRLEFLEQPFAPARMAREIFPPEIAAKLALDESVSSAETLPGEWSGWVVVKPLQLGDRELFLRWRKTTSARVVYSSIFETAVGRETALQLAADAPATAGVAQGFDTLGVFEPDGWDAHPSGARAAPLHWPPARWEAWWRAQTGGAKRAGAAPGGASELFSRAPIERFLTEQFFPENDALTARRVFAETLTHLENNTVAAVAVARTIPAAYLGALLAGLAAGRTVYCANPHWRATEWREAETALPGGTVVLGDDTARRMPGSPQLALRAALHIPTGGTGGRVRFVAHTAATLRAAARAQVAALGAGCPGGVSPLPPWHISGIMPVVRALVSGGWLYLCDGGFAEPTPLPELPETGDFSLLSLVPTQLLRLLAHTGGPAWLRRFDCVLLGGAATPPGLLDAARREKIRLAPGYGMTETAAFVAWQEPAAFLRGEPVAFQPLAHAKISIEDATGRALPEGAPGRVVIAAESLAPEVGDRDATGARRWRTQDEGFFQGGKLCLLGRADRHIITGGEKVDPLRVETVLASSPLVRAALVVGEPDVEWGSRVVALVELTSAAGENWAEVLQDVVRGKLARHCVPRCWIAVPRLPLNERGKLDHAALAACLGERR